MYRWGADARYLQYRAAAPPREDPLATRGLLPSFATVRASSSGTGTGTGTGCAPDPNASAAAAAASAEPLAPARPLTVDEMLADPRAALSAMPEHTQRLILAQSMLSVQQRFTSELRRRHFLHLDASRRVLYTGPHTTASAW